jgi:Rha family phage regulatory protein
MESLVLKSQDGTKYVTTSLIVADVFNRNHADVLRDIRNLHCSTEFFESNFAECLTIIPLETGESRQKYYEMTKDGFMFLVMGYTGEKAAKWKETVIDAFNKMESLLRNDEYIMARAHEIAVRNIKMLEEEVTKNKEQLAIADRQLSEAAPKLEYYNNVLQDKEGITTTIIAKELGMSAEALNIFLHERGVIYKSQKTWVLYAKYQDRGYTKTKTSYHTDPLTGNIISEIHTYWTQAGRKFILNGVKKIREKSDFSLKFK